jgi:hypothetical protein
MEAGVGSIRLVLLLPGRLGSCGEAKALEASTEKARPKISFEVFMVVAPDRLVVNSVWRQCYAAEI